MTTTIEGIALTPTMDLEGTDWTEEALREATPTLEGVPVVARFGPDPPEIGEVTESEYKDDEGVWYRAELDASDFDIHDAKMAPAMTIGAPAEAESGNLSVEGLQFESMAPVPEATEAVGDHEVVETEDEGGSA